VREFIIIVQGYVGILPLEANQTLVIVPDDLGTTDSLVVHNLISFMLDIFGFSAERINIGANSNRLRSIMEIALVEDLINSLKEQLERLPSFPLPNFESVQKTRNGIRGRILSSNLFKHLFLKPHGKLECAYSELLIDNLENRVIKAAIQRVIDGEFCQISKESRRFFDHALTMMTETGVRKADIQDLNNPIQNPKAQYKQLITLSKILLWGPGLSTADDLLELNLPFVAKDHKFFEELVRRSLRLVEPNSEVGSISVSSKSEHTFNPDIVISAKTSKSYVVADVKLKSLSREQHGTDNRPDIYQVISHSLAFSPSNRLALFYPSFDGTTGSSAPLVLDKINPSKQITAVWVDQKELLKFITERHPSELTRNKLIDILEIISEHAVAHKVA
jgi:5-methylcytosine-specific restriction endonuclease McrBC regulatory subunit McrC